MNKHYLMYIPHGIDHEKKYFPINQEYFDQNPEIKEEFENFRRVLLKEQNIEFIVFYNARNLRRKQTSDVLLAYNHFLSKLSTEQAEKCRLLMHTQTVDEHGTDLVAVINDVVPRIKVIFSNQMLDYKQLNFMYNIASVTINIASNEGFGLGTCESLLAGTPIIVNVTGGLQDQCGFMTDDGKFLTEYDYISLGSNADGQYKKHGDWAFPIWPNNRSLQGSPATPYIFDDRCDWKEVGDSIKKVYDLGPVELKHRGLLGREFAITRGKFTSKTQGELIIRGINEVLKNWKPRERYTITKV